jgi:hypothetical protein
MKECEPRSREGTKRSLKLGRSLRDFVASWFNLKFGILCFVLICPIAQAASPTTWPSATTGTVLNGTVMTPQVAPGSALPTVVYLKNLSVERIGQEDDDAIVSDLLKNGHLVLVLDYAHHANAVSPQLNADMLKIRQDIADKKNPKLLNGYNVDLAHLFILAEGNRLKRDVEFARDGQRVLGMDIQYPSKPKRAVPVLMEITCDNQNRMGTTSLLFCHDTLLDGAPAAGFAVAMVDHPVPPPYKGLDDPMKESVERMKSAVHTLRALSPALGFTDKVGAIGFSRGGPFAAILACTGDVNAALIHGNRYDYLNLLDNDPMLARFEKAWGPREANKANWAEHGAVTYLPADGSRVTPMFLNTSNAESPEYQKGLADFAKRLDQFGVEHVYQVDQDGRGHRVSTEPKTLSSIYAFFAKHLGG